MNWLRRLLPWRTPEERRIIRLKRDPLAPIRFDWRERYNNAMQDSIQKMWEEQQSNARR